MKRNVQATILFVVLIGLAMGAILLVTRSAAAQNLPPTPVPNRSVSDNEVNRVAKKLYCPVCPNTPLDVCETQACKDWRSQIRDQLASGWSDQQVMDYFVKSYGERVLAEPERAGFTSLVWLLPVIAVLLGLVLVGLILKSWRAHQKALLLKVPENSPGAKSVSREVLAKIEAEIRKMD